MNKFFFMGLLLFKSILSLENNELLNTISHYNDLIPKTIELRQRVLTTVCCQDCKYLPKVENSGKVIEDSGYSYQIMHNGIKILKDCYYGKWMTNIIEILEGHHEPQEEKIFHETLKCIPDCGVMVELGSYWGYYSMWFQKEIKHAKNFLIEPDAINLEIGKNNFSLNAMNGHFTQAMLGAYSTEKQIFIDWNYNTYPVKQVSMDDFAVENNIDFIDILHSDIQGAEFEMLKGCKKLITENKIGYFFISTHRGMHEQCLQFFHENNLEVILSITREESFSADGLIVAKLPSLPMPENLDISRRTVDFCQAVESLDTTKSQAKIPVVEVVFTGLLGNRLFDFCMGKIVAEQLGFNLYSRPIWGFPTTYGYQNNTPPHEFPEEHIIGSGIDCRFIDVQKIIKDRSLRNIKLQGFFHKYKYLKDYKQKIRNEWLKLDPSMVMKQDPNDLVLHIRNQASAYILPFEYYEKALSSINYRQLFICIDEPNDPFLKNFQKYNPIIKSTRSINQLMDANVSWDEISKINFDEFLFIQSFNKIIISQSTYSWWAAFLSNAQEIYAPFCNDENIQVYGKVDEDRYHYIVTTIGKRDAKKSRSIFAHVLSKFLSYL